MYIYSSLRLFYEATVTANYRQRADGIGFNFNKMF